MPRTARALLLAAVASLALTPIAAPAQGAQQGVPTLATRFDSTADTVFARVAGISAPARVHRLVQELSVAPGADDTTLFTQVQGFEVDRAGRIWAFDQPTATIFLFGRDGALVRRIGRKGGGPGEFQSNNGAVVLPGDRFAIWDGRNARISWHAPDGTFERTTLVSRGFFGSSALVTDRSGAVFIKYPVSRDRTRSPFDQIGLIHVRPDGTLGDTLVPPDLKVPAVAYTGSRDNGRATATMSSRNVAGASWTWHADGFFVTVDGLRSRIVLSRRTAKPIVIERRLPPVRISGDERADDEAWITWMIRQTVPGWNWSGPAVPDTKPSVSMAFAARDGRIWVRVATPSERIPEGELPEQRPNGPPRDHFRSPAEWEVYASDGTFLGRVALPRDTQLMEADGNTVWALGRDDDDLPALRRYRIEPPLPGRGGR